MEQRPSPPVTFGSAIADARRRLGKSQKEIAARILKEDRDPISPQYLNDLERDRRNPPSEYLLDQFASELNLPREYLDYLAGQIPADLRRMSAPPEQVEKAFTAFRKALSGTTTTGDRR